MGILNELLAQLGQVASEAGRGIRPSAREIDVFLSHYHFDSRAVIEPIKISTNGVFEFYMFAVWNPTADSTSLMVMWPKY